MTLKEALALAVKVLKQVMEEKLNASNIQVATVTVADGFKILSEDSVAEVISTLS